MIQKMKMKNRHIIFDYSKNPEYRLLCLICNKSILVELPIEIDELSEIDKSFIREHKTCKSENVN